MVGRRLISTNSTTRCCDYRCPEVILPDFPRAGITMEIGRSRETRRSILLLAVIYIFERSCFRSIRCGFHGFHGPVPLPPPNSGLVVHRGKRCRSNPSKASQCSTTVDRLSGNTWRRDLTQIARSS